jgi:YegS/Rv2252/BmrU family lipid kinase
MTPAPLPRTAALIVNARSRRGRASFRAACRKLKAAGIALPIAHAVRRPNDLIGRVREAVQSGVKMVIVGGGDGTISSSVGHLVGHDTIFAILPLGTANSFARTLGVPLDLEGAIEVIASGTSRTIDLGMIDDAYFANCATMGIAPQIAATVPHGLKAWLGRPGYLIWAAWQLVRFRPFRLTVESDGGRETLTAVEVRIANGPYHGGVALIDEARLDSGRIAVQVVIGGTRRRLVANWLASVLRLDARNRDVRTFEGAAIRLVADPPMRISIDGEVLARTPVMAKVARRAIRVAAPQD